MAYEKRICGLTGKLINVPVNDSPKKLSKNRIKKNRYKAQKRARKTKVLSVRVKSKIQNQYIMNEYYKCNDSFKIGMSPEAKLIMAGH